MKRQTKTFIGAASVCGVYAGVYIGKKTYVNWRMKVEGESRRVINRRLGIKPQLYILGGWSMILLGYNMPEIKSYYEIRKQELECGRLVVVNEMSYCMKMALLTILVNATTKVLASLILSEDITDTSENQSLVEEQLIGKNSVEMIIFAIFIAPLIEEYIFRKTINGKILNGFGEYSYILGGLIFALAHVGVKPFKENAKHAIYTTCEYIGASIVISKVYAKHRTIIKTVPIHMMVNMIGVGGVNISHYIEQSKQKI